MTVVRQFRLASCIVIALASQHVVAGDLPPSTRAEIDHLLAYLEQSGCRFERNGKWHDSAEARAHMERKLRWLEKRDLVATTEQFIERAATESSRSGKPYRVQCEPQEPVASAAWFAAELARWRAAARGETAD